MNKREALKDEQILAKIIAGGMASGRKILPDGLRRARGSSNMWGVTPRDVPEGPACAVGAGCLYAGITTVGDPVLAFAAYYGVSEAYAWGVSDGFENPCPRVPGSGYGGPTGKRNDKEYHRGALVGGAARVFFGRTGRDGE